MGVFTGTLSTAAGLVFLALALFWVPAACVGSIPIGLQLEFAGIAVIFFGLAIGLYTLYVPGMITVMSGGATLLVAGIIVASTLPLYCIVP